MAASWNGSLTVNNKSGGPLNWAVTNATGPVGKAGASGTLKRGVQTLKGLPVAAGQRLYISQSPLKQSVLAAKPALPDPFNANVDGRIPYSFWEYTANSKGFTWDTSYVGEWSYPLQTVVTPAGSRTPRTYGLASLPGAIARLISQPNFAPRSGKGKAGNLVWSSTPPDPSWPATPALNNRRIVGPLNPWQLQQGGGNLQLLPKAMQQFVAAVPWNGNDLSASATNLNTWNQALQIANGYTAALAAQAKADGGVAPQPQTGSPAQFRGFFTYPQEERFGQVTDGAVPDQLIVNPLTTAKHRFGTNGADTLRGTARNDVIVGGHGADRLSGRGGRDRYWLLHPASSRPGRGRRDLITDFSADDRIDLSALDADRRQPGLQPFRWLGREPFSGQAGELRLSRRASGLALLQADTRGTGNADLEIALRDLEVFGRSNLVL